MGYYTGEIRSDAELLSMEQRHVLALTPGPPVCEECGQRFPCEVRQLLVHIFASRRAFRVLGKHKRSSV